MPKQSVQLSNGVFNTNLSQIKKYNEASRVHNNNDSLLKQSVVLTNGSLF
jgi:hypothetical protein